MKRLETHSKPWRCHLATAVVILLGHFGCGTELTAATETGATSLTLAEVKDGSYTVTESWSVVLDYSDWAGTFTGTRRFSGKQSGTISVQGGHFEAIDRSGIAWVYPGRNLKSRSLSWNGVSYSLEGNYAFVPAFGATAHGIVFVGCFVVGVPLVDGEVPAFSRVSEYTAHGTSLNFLSGSGSMLGSSLDASVSSTLSLTRIVGPPTIVQQPQKQAIVVGQDMTMSVLAGGDGPFGYTWRKGTTVLAGQNASSLTLTNVQPGDAGSYSVTITNSGGKVLSAAAQLIVGPTPPVWFEGWESAALGSHSLSNADPTLITGDKGRWSVGDTASNFPECSTAHNHADIVQEASRKSLKLYSSSTQGGCAENVWIEIDPQSSASLPIPLVRSTQISFFELGSMDHPTWNGEFGCITPPCGDTVSLRVTDVRQNQVLYVFQRATNYVEHALTNGLSNLGYREIFLDPAGGQFSRNLYDDLGSIAGTVGVGKNLSSIEFSLSSAGWALLDDLRIAPSAANPDTTKPTLTITAPTASQRWSNSVFSARGTASDTSPIVDVFWQLNGGSWNLASTTNNWTNWTAILPLETRSNLLSVLAVDAAGNASMTNTRSFVYAKHVPVEFRVSGRGTLNPNYTNALLELGTLQTVTATPGTGYRFVRWDGSLQTSNRALKFLVDSNLAFTAHFEDTNRPAISVSSPPTGYRSSNALAIITGKATDNDQVADVWFRMNSEDWALATGTTNWTITTGLSKGTNQFQIYAQDRTGNSSITNRMSIVSSNAFELNLSVGLAPGPIQSATIGLQATPRLRGRIESSTNLVLWNIWANFYVTNAALIRFAPDTSNVPQRFYRAIVP